MLRSVICEEDGRVACFFLAWCMMIAVMYVAWRQRCCKWEFYWLCLLSILVDSGPVCEKSCFLVSCCCCWVVFS